MSVGGSDEAVIIDVRGLKCPLPVLKAARRMAPHPPGTRFLVLATDPMAAIDVPHMCRQEGFDVVELTRDGDVARFTLKRPK